ncbi:MAG: hypothetical protein ACI9GM_000764 [Salibacteraceae bacterium]|jgi:hypothetical protein
MKLLYKIIVVFVATLLIIGCKRKFDKIPNTEPETLISPESINLTGDNRLNSVVFLSWFGTDLDGYVASYEISLDNQNWVSTTANDSTFSFTLNPGSDTTDINFYVRSIDNEGFIDPSPAYLKVPLKNTPPVVFFNVNGFPQDTTNIVTTFTWDATDVDGNETITKAYLKANQGDWLEIDINEEMISLVPQDVTQTGSVSANVFYGTNQLPLSTPLNGLVVGDTNHFFLKVIDFANAESVPDTSEVVFIKPKTSDILYISALPKTPTDVYKGAISPIAANYEFIDYSIDNGINQPGFWSPTFDLLLANYDQVIMTSDESIFTNSATGRKDVFLAFAAPSVQVFSNNGGKSLVATSFNKGQDISGITGVFPIDSLSSANGQARLYPDSAIVSMQGVNYPDLSPSFIISGLSPFYISIGAEESYAAEIFKQGGWEGPATVGARRKNGNNNYYQYFFSVQLYKLDQSTTDLQNLFDQILNNDFNW